MLPRTNDKYLKQDVNNIQRRKIPKEPETQYPSKILLKS